MAQQGTGPSLRSASRWRTVKDVIDTLVVLGFLYLLYSAFAHKAAYINKIYGPYAGCSDCFTRCVFAHDGAMLGAVGLLYLGSMWLRRYSLALVCGLRSAGAAAGHRLCCHLREFHHAPEAIGLLCLR